MSKIKFLFLLTFLAIFTNCNCCKKACFKSKMSKPSGNTCYTSGTFDMFHVGHLNLLQNAKGLCDTLIVGVHPDDVVFAHKNKKPIIPLEQRIAIIRAIKFVDAVVVEPEYDYTKTQIDKFKVNTLVIGDDYLLKYKEIEEEMKQYGVKMIFLTYTQYQSSSKIRASLK